MTPKPIKEAKFFAAPNAFETGMFLPDSGAKEITFQKKPPHNSQRNKKNSDDYFDLPEPIPHSKTYYNIYE